MCLQSQLVDCCVCVVRVTEVASDQAGLEHARVRFVVDASIRLLNQNQELKSGRLFLPFAVWDQEVWPLN
jgi:hypothetical protein